MAAPKPSRSCRGLALCAVLLLIGQISITPGATAAGLPEIRAMDLSFAVLPLQNATGDPRQHYVTDALTDDLTIDLSRIRDSLVIARSSAAALVAKTPGIGSDAAAHQLGVRYVLHGTAALRDGRVRLSGALFDAEAASDVWAAEFVRPEAELAALRSALVTQLADRVNATTAVATNQPISDAEVIDQLLQAQALLLGPQTAQSAAAARRLLEAALRRAPQTGKAMTALGSVHLAEALAGWSPAPRQDLAEAQRLVDGAITADPQDSRALALRGALLRVEGKPVPALAAYEAAVAADPNLADAYAEIGRLKIDLGRAEETAAAIERALRLSPLDPQRPLWMSFAGMALLYADRPVDAVPWLEKSVALKQDFLNPRVWLAAAYELQGRSDKAADAVKEALRISPALNIARLERQLAGASQRSRQQLSLILDALRRAGLPG